MKGVIVAAGYGTRFLPVTKTIPKEMLPLINRPAIAFIVDEFIASGITDIIIISSRRKKSLEDYFDTEAELQAVFTREGKKDKLDQIAPPAAHISYVRQTEMRGTGHALLQAAPFLGSEPCVVAYPDDLHFGEVPLAKQLMEVYEKTGCSVFSAEYDPGDVSRYGVIDPAPDGIHMQGFVEKPAPGTEPSHEISIGRYLYTPEFFELLAEGWGKHTGGEYYHLYALEKLIAQNKVAWTRLSGQRLDTGEPEGYLNAILEYSWKDSKLRTTIEGFMKTHGVQTP